MQNNILDCFTIKSTLNELMKVGETKIADNLLDILNHNELPKPEKHNRKEDICTSYYNINLSREFIDRIVDLFVDLEIGSLTENGESTNATNYYIDLLEKWLKIKDEQN